MKTTPLATGGNPGQAIGQITNERVSSEAISRAKAVAQGLEPKAQEPKDPMVDRTQASLRKIKMKTNVSPDRYVPPTSPEVPTQETKTEEVIDTSSTQEGEANKPLSPQFAALAKQRRALQVKESEIAKKEELLKQREASLVDRTSIMADIKRNPLGILKEAGVTYEELAQQITSNPVTAESLRIAELEAKIASLEKGVDEKLTSRDQQTEQQVLKEIGREVRSIVAQGDDFELIRGLGKQSDVVRLIHENWKQTGEVLDTHEACKLLEDELFEEEKKILGFNKVKKLLPQQDQPLSTKSKPLTLTNSDTAAPKMSARERAIKAFYGQR